MKKCKCCNKVKPLSEFPKTSWAHNGVRKYSTRKVCKYCYHLNKAKDKDLYIKQKEFEAERELLEKEGKRRCTKCSEVKLWDDFPNDKSGRSRKGKKSYCKACAQKMRYAYLQTPAGKMMKKKSDKKWASNNKDWISSYSRKKYHEDIQHKLKVTIRNRLNDFLRTKGIRKYTSSTYSIGCTYEELQVWIESQFQEGMTWDNHQLVGGWHLDHKKELCTFDLTDPKQLEEAQHYTNLQPLWAKDNLSKRNWLLTNRD